jgi:hypothetical protein
MKAKDVRKGTVIIYKNTLHSVMDFHHHTPGYDYRWHELPVPLPPTHHA